MHLLILITYTTKIHNPSSVLCVLCKLYQTSDRKDLCIGISRGVRGVSIRAVSRPADSCNYHYKEILMNIFKKT